MPTFSIITVNLNNKIGLRKTIESVLQQKFTDWEIIVIDGGSTDGSLDIIDEFSSKIKYYISEPDDGPYDAMNKGIAKASGVYINFLNSGDYYYNENVLESVRNKMLDYDLIWGNTCYICPDNKKIRTNFAEDEPLSAFSLESHGSINHQAVFIKNSIMQSALYDIGYKILADYNFFYNKIVVEKCSLKRVCDVIVYFDKTGLSSRPEFSDTFRKEKWQVRSAFLPDLVNKDYEELSPFICDKQLLCLFKKIGSTKKFIVFAGYILQLFLLFVKRKFF